MAVWIPQVGIPDISTRDYSQQLYNAAAGPGQAIYQNRRDRVGDLQFASEQERLKENADRDYALELQKFEAGGGTSGVYGTPLPYLREDGTVGYKVIEKSTGQLRDLDFAGGQPLSPAHWMETGPTYTGFDKYGNPLAAPPISRNLPEAAAQTEQGQRAGIARDALPQVEFQTEKLLGEIDAVMKDPNLPYLTGPGGGRLPAWFGTTDPGGMAATQANITQLVQESFLQAYNALRGAGAITQQEGQAAKEAQTVLSTQEMDDAAYVKALEKYRFEAEQMLAVARARAEGRIPPIGGVAPPAPDASTGETITNIDDTIVPSDTNGVVRRR